MKSTKLTQAILELVSRPRYRPAKPRVIAQRLGLPKAEVAEVKKLIKKMIAKNTVIPINCRKTYI